VPTPKKPEKKSAAFFDLDNTLLRGSSTFLFGKEAVKLAFFTRKDLWRFGLSQLRFIWRGESAKMLKHIEDRAMTLAVGQNAAELEKLIESVWENHISKRLWPETVRIAQEHVAAGRDVWIVTASPVQMGEFIAKKLGLTGSLGTILEIKDGLLTGEFIGRPLHGKRKAKAVRALALEKNYSLRKSYAYSDSHNDLHMLARVGHPVAVNPDKILTKHAKAAGWKILDFKKRELKRHWGK
jgi:HAD superfamily hydrolase (TIGR01490 family)